jgi:hypothetical protein
MKLKEGWDSPEKGPEGDMVEGYGGIEGARDISPDVGGIAPTEGPSL